MLDQLPNICSQHICIHVFCSTPFQIQILEAQDPFTQLSVAMLDVMEVMVLATFVAGFLVGAFITALVLCCAPRPSRKDGVLQSVFVSKTGRAFHLYATCCQRENDAKVMTELRLCKHCSKGRVPTHW